LSLFSYRGHRYGLEAAAKNEERVILGSLLAQIGRESGGVELAIERDPTPTEPASFDQGDEPKEPTRV
jgi:hypothetical protein